MYKLKVETIHATKTVHIIQHSQKENAKQDTINKRTTTKMSHEKSFYRYTTMFDWEYGPHHSFLGPKPVDSVSERLQHTGQPRSSVLLQERNGAFSDILYINPHLVGRRHPVSVEVREFDWEKKEDGSVSASSDQDHSTQHPKDYKW